MTKKRGLGRGLSELGLKELLSAVKTPVATTVGLPPNPANTPTDLPATMVTSHHDTLQEIAIEQLHPNAKQPRQFIDDEKLAELAASIRTQGIIQPLVVRPLGKNQYQIIAGERRWRAAQQAGLSKIPVIVRALSDEDSTAIALIENIQRQDLNAMEEAIALDRLMTEFHLTHQQVAEAVGKSRTAVTNLLRLLKLNSDVKALLQAGQLEMGHARALLALEGLAQSQMADRIVSKQWSVRETEQQIRLLQQKAEQAAMPAPARTLSPELKDLQKRMARQLGLQVKIKPSTEERGKIVISYHNQDELQALLNRLPDEPTA